MAFGPLGLTPRAYRRLTPAEFQALYKGWTWRVRSQEDQIAIWVCVLINHTGMVKQAVNPVRLLGRPLTGPPE